MKEEFEVKKIGSCKQVFIPRGYCTVYLQDQAKDYIEKSVSGKDVCIENLASDLPCQKLLVKEKHNGSEKVV